MTTYIYPYSQASTSARVLAEAMGIKRLKTQGRFIPSERDTVINWGASDISRSLGGAEVVNPAHAVRVAINKLLTYQALKENGISVPEWTLQRDIALDWVRAGHTVYGRDAVTGSAGAGITVYPSGSSPDSIGNHRFFTKYYKHKSEIRVHAFAKQKDYAQVVEALQRTGFEASLPCQQGDAGVTFIQRKARRSEARRTDYGHFTRNHGTEYTFVRRNINPTSIILGSCIRNCFAGLGFLGLKFGAFDCVVNQNGDHCILEVNTAPGIEGSSIELYKEFLQ